MKRIILGLTCLLMITTGKAGEETKSLYSGGMLILQPGFTMATNEHQDIRGMSSSIGGILRMYFCEHFTAGVYGGRQKTSYTTNGSDNSYLSLGYGGPFIGVTRKSGKFRYTASAFAGMGSFRNLHIDNQTDSFLSDANFYKAATVVYSPIISLDYAITKRIYLTAQTLCLMGQFENKSFYNPTFQLGILFSR
ncbi:MAG: hypothetical protein PHQ11_00855 [Paludibacter sp.]|nr:hypothetical protein [Paludibacter sp.]MDD4198416.1 hypothetical protein [Paludibacter sp.]MDD4427094.1 hypothetical protein [Paludibacter sp.]